MSFLIAVDEDRGRDWEPEPFELPLVDPGSSRLPPKAPLPYGEGSTDDDDGERRNRVIVIDLA